MPAPPALIASYGWAHHCMRWLHDNDKAAFLLDPDTTIPMSTWFSGFGFAEWALEFIAAARRDSLLVVDLVNCFNIGPICLLKREQSDVSGVSSI